MSVHDFGKRDAASQQKRSTTLRHQVPAFRMDDAVLEEVWRAIEAKCAEAGPPSSRLTVHETLRAPGRGARERHEYKYRSIDDLRRASNAPTLLQDYRLSVSSPWGDDYRSVCFFASGSGAAWMETSAPDAGWCHEVLDSVLDRLRPHTAWYAIVHRVGSYGTVFASLGMGAVMIWADLAGYPIGAVEVAVYGLSLGIVVALEFFRDRLLPAAEIRVARQSRDTPAVN